MTNVTTGAPPHPLIARLFEVHGYEKVDVAGVDAFVQGRGHAVLVFTEDPLRVKETLDIAVILPEVVRAFAGRFRVGVLLPDAARELLARYGLRRWPALVVLRDGAYVGAIEGLRNWDEYLEEVARLLGGQPTRPPTIGIAVKAADAGNAGCAH